VVVEETTGKVLGKISTEPSDASTWRDSLENTNGKDNVASSTVPSNPRQRVNSDPANGVNVIENASGKAVQIRYIDPVTGAVKDANIPYDSRGLPIFDDVAAYTTRIDPTKSYTAQMSQATRDLRDAINSGKVDAGQFTQAQLNDIQAGKGTITDFRWHHNSQSAPNNMQLIPKNVHEAVSHVGQGALIGGR
jgi:filamentous hemagglutinin